MAAYLPNGACPADKPANEAKRVKALHDLNVLDSLPEPMFDDIALLASQICGTPIALISLVDSERQWFKAKVGLDAPETPRDLAFCAHAILNPEQVLIVDDALQDQRFATNPLVQDNPNIRFYAGAPIVTTDGLTLGTVCAIDRQAKQITAEQAKALQALSRQVARMLTFRRASMARIEAVEQALGEQTQAAQQLMSFTVLDLDLKSFVDRQYVYRAVNNAYLAYWNRQRSDVLGKTVSDVFGLEVFEAYIRPILDRALAGETVDLDVEPEFPGKGKRRVQMTFVPARSAEGDIVGVVVNAHDVQELSDVAERLREANNQLEEKNLAQQKFIYMLSHDLREPVNTIINFSGVLESKLAEQADQQSLKFARFVHGGGKRLKDLLDNLLDYVRLEQQAVRVTEVDLSEVIREVQADLSHSLERNQGDVQCEALPLVAGDHHLLRVLFQNLISNAVKFVSPGVQPTVRISAQASTNGWQIKVEDNGIGIEDAHLGKLFQVFKRLNSLKQYDGVGLGLASCKRIVQMHGGQIGVNSVPGKGSCFWVELPQARVCRDLAKP